MNRRIWLWSERVVASAKKNTWLTKRTFPSILVAAYPRLWGEGYCIGREAGSFGRWRRKRMQIKATWCYFSMEINDCIDLLKLMEIRFLPSSQRRDPILKKCKYPSRRSEIHLNSARKEIPNSKFSEESEQINAYGKSRHFRRVEYLLTNKKLGKVTSGIRCSVFLVHRHSKSNMWLTWTLTTNITSTRKAHFFDLFP